MILEVKVWQTMDYCCVGLKYIIKTVLKNIEKVQCMGVNLRQKAKLNGFLNIIIR